VPNSKGKLLAIFICFNVAGNPTLNSESEGRGRISGGEWQCFSKEKQFCELRSDS
jgi:hypothetical protein